MFSGIIEAQAYPKTVIKKSHCLEMVIEKPSLFNDISVGDSMACNGVCLTVESFDSSAILFVIGFETLQVTGWTAEGLKGQCLNLERSLKLGQRIHGHFVTGHVDFMVEVLKEDVKGECKILSFDLPEKYKNMIWEKGSVTLNGVSLTVNNVRCGHFEVCLIPETLRATNLRNVKCGMKLCMEVDQYARAIHQKILEMRSPNL